MLNSVHHCLISFRAGINGLPSEIISLACLYQGSFGCLYVTLSLETFDLGIQDAARIVNDHLGSSNFQVSIYLCSQLGLHTSSQILRVLRIKPCYKENRAEYRSGHQILMAEKFNSELELISTNYASLKRGRNVLHNAMNNFSENDIVLSAFFFFPLKDLYVDYGDA